MADGSTAASLKGAVSQEEWAARVSLAALYRLAALQGWDDIIFTHISARVPGEDDHFLINPYGALFEEITASSLVKINFDGEIVQDTKSIINGAGFTVHSAVHQARDDAHFVIHLHTDQGVAVSTQAEGLLPLTQHGLMMRPFLAYHDYEGLAFNLGERERLASDLGDKNLMMLRNHGTLALGPSAAVAWMRMYFLEKACLQQIMALSAGRDRVTAAPQAAQDEVQMVSSFGFARTAELAWPGLLRRLDRRSPGYDA